MKKCLKCGTMNDDIVSSCLECDNTTFENINYDNSKNVIERSKTLATKGNKKAQFFIGKIYFFGIYGFQKNIEKAKEWFYKASVQGHNEATEYVKQCEDMVKQKILDEQRERERQRLLEEKRKNGDAIIEKAIDIKKQLLLQNKKSFPAFICKNCESIIPLDELSHNLHRTIQVYGTDLLDTLGKQYLFDTFLSEKHVACPHCASESLLSLGTPLAESLIKKHCDNEEYRTILFSNPTDIIEKYNAKVKKQKNGCYIATAVYNSYDCPEVWTLRRFRDFVLLENFVGKLFVKVYYFVSPTIVKYWGKTKIFNLIFKTILDKFVVFLNNKGFENTRYEDKR